MTAERIALISDCEGNVAALQAALRAIKRHAPDSIVVAGDILASPFSPDPPSETIALLRSEPVQTIPGNTDRYLLEWHPPHRILLEQRRLRTYGGRQQCVRPLPEVDRPAATLFLTLLNTRD